MRSEMEDAQRCAPRRSVVNEPPEPEATPLSSGLPTAHERGSWRATAVGATSLAAPVGLGAFHPLVGEIFATVELAVLLTVIGTALFGSHALSERAFRLLRWLGNRPEPPEPSSRSSAKPGRVDDCE
jgi:hypothetical protein